MELLLFLWPDADRQPFCMRWSQKPLSYWALYRTVGSRLPYCQSNGSLGKYAFYPIACSCSLSRSKTALCQGHRLLLQALCITLCLGSLLSLVTITTAEGISISATNHLVQHPSLQLEPDHHLTITRYSAHIHRPYRTILVLTISV